MSMVALWEWFAEIFSTVVQLQQRLHSEEQPAFQEVRTTIESLFARQEALAQAQRREQEFREALFPVVAWVDETILQVDFWEGHVQWKQCPLQQLYFDIRDAGDQFFPRLKSLQPEQSALREVYYLCVALGFHGPYEAHQLAPLRRDLAQHLPVAVEDPWHLSYVTPQPYDPANVPLQNPGPQRAWHRVLLTTLGCCGALLLMAWFLVPRPHPPDPGYILKDLQKLGLLDCAKVTVRDIQAPTPVIVLEGRVPDAAQAAKIVARVRDLRLGSHVRETLARVPRPFCEVLAMLDRFLDNERGLTVELKPQYTIGDHLVLQGQTPAFASYLYIFYITEENGVWQLAPHVRTGPPPPLFAPKTLYTIGKERFTVKITGPAGRKCIVVLAGQEPLSLVLPTQQSGQAVPMASFLHALEQALSDAAPIDVAVVYHFIYLRDSHDRVPRG
jgi:type VI secretion system protein ImpK